MSSHDEQLQKFQDRLEKATYKGEQGKFRRLKGKTVFIRTKDKKVTKGPNKGKRLLMKGVSSEESRKKKHKNCGCKDHTPVSKSIHENLGTIIRYMEELNIAPSDRKSSEAGN